MNSTNDIQISPVLSDNKWRTGSFKIDPYSNCIQYKVDDSLIDTITKLSDDRRASRCSDLLELLKIRNYNLLDSKGINPNSGELGFISKYDEDGCSSEIEVISSHISVRDIQKIMSLQSDLLNMQIGYIPGTYISDGTGDYSYPDKYGLRENYYNFRLVLDLINKSSIINVLPLDGPTYTDSLDLERILYDSSTYSSASIRLGIKFTVEDSDIVSIKEIIFPYDTDIINEIDGLVKLEYINKCIRLFSLSEVNECIISYCHILCKFK